MKIEEFAKRTPSPRFVGRKGFLSAVCALLCIVFAFALAGCGSCYTDEDDYANFVKWQARYETEKELVELLREYDAAYKAYYSDATLPATIEFVFEDTAILSDANITAVDTSYYGSDYVLTITLDAAGANIFANFTATHIGESLSIIEIEGDSRTVLWQAVISSTIGNGIVPIYGLEVEAVNDLRSRIEAKCADSSLKRIAAAYNEKRSGTAARYITSDYLPNALSTEPDYTNVAAYLKKAEAMGF